MRQDDEEEALRLSEERHRLASEAAGEGLWDWDLAGGHCYASPRYCAILGFEPGELPPSVEGWKRLVHAGDLTRASSAIERFLTGGDSAYHDEYRVRRKSGDYIWIGAHAVAVGRDSAGRALRVVGTIADISARKNAELTYVRDQEELAAICDNAPVMMALVDSDRRIRKLNRIAMEAANRHDLDAVGKVGGDALRCVHSLEHSKGCGYGPECHRCTIRSTITDTFATRRSHLHVEATLSVWSGGQQKNLVLLLSTALLQLGEEPMVLVCLLDITERKAAEAAVRSGEQRFVYFMRNLPAHAYIKDGHGKYLYANELLEGLLRDSGGVVGKTDEELWQPETAATFTANDRQALSQDAPITIEEPGIVSGRPHTFLTTKFRFLGADGTYLVGGISLDITDHKQAEAHLAEAERIESIGRLAGGVAHDFNNWLTVINGYTSMVLSKISPADPLGPALKQVQKAGAKAAGLTRQLLAFSRKQILEPRVLSIDHVLAEMQALLTRLAGERVETRWKPSAAGLVCADRRQLEQAVINLVLNARDAMPRGGSLTLETSDVKRGARDCVMLAITDTGHGMDEETRIHIFEPFFTTKEAGKGTGLGLPMVQGLVAQSGGFMEVDSEPGRGTQFRMYLPAVEGQAEDCEEAEPASNGIVHSGGETVLVVEDQSDVRQYVVVALGDSGYTVFEAANAEAAESICRTERIDLMLSDVVLPGLTGPQLATHLSMIQPEMKLLFMSGYVGGAMSEARLLEPAVLITKPFRPGQLTAKVREVLGPVKCSGRILVVDDQPEVRAYLRDVLTSAGHEVTEAADGADAIKAARCGNLDLVVTDLVMPVQEGIETIQVLRQEVPSLKIVAISGESGGRYLRVAKLLGAHAVLEKPVDRRALLAKVNELLCSRPLIPSDPAA